MPRLPSESGAPLSFRSKLALLGAAALGLLAAAGCSGVPNADDPNPGVDDSLVFPGVGTPYAGVCPVQFFQECKACHDGRGTAGTRMGLNFWEDFHAPAASNPTAQVFQVLPNRLKSSTPTPMPPEGALDAQKLAAIDQWVAAGAPDCGFPRRNPPPPPPPPPGAGGTWSAGGAQGYAGTPPGAGGAPYNPGAGGAPIVPGGGGAPVGAGGSNNPPPYDVTPYLSADGLSFIKEPPGDKPVGPDAPGADYCFNILSHGAQTPLPTDASPYAVRAAEFYHMFQYKVPYTKPSWALSTRPIIDNNRVLHHWLLFKLGSGGADGSHADEIGLQLNNELLTGWAPGGNPLDMPPGVGLEMPAPGGFIGLENHYNNITGGGQQDRSGVRMCVTFTPPQNPASLTWLGTELINVPAQREGSAAGTCSSWKKNTDVHVIQAVPHMHTLGKHMKTTINRAAGGQDILIDKPFTFTDQRAYPIDVVVKAGDTLTTTCTWQNTTSAGVAFGTATSAEMCYNFVIYYPAHALDGIGGIEGSKNMCLF